MSTEIDRVSNPNDESQMRRFTEQTKEQAAVQNKLIAALEKRIAALEARVKALEA